MKKGEEKGNTCGEKNVPFPNFYSVHKRSFATKNVLLRDPHHFMNMEKTFFKYQEGKAKQYNVKYIYCKNLISQLKLYGAASCEERGGNPNGGSATEERGSR